jgi:A/G-specific adenine glycosylase
MRSAAAVPTPAVAAPLLAWYRRHRRDLPWRESRDPYRVWVSEVMLQQTQVERVREFFTRFMLRFPAVAALARAPERDVLKHWEGLGYYRRARQLHAAAKQIVAEHGGEFPRTAAGLRGLPGIGRYTAGAIASIAFGEPEPIVEANSRRVIARLVGHAKPVGGAGDEPDLSLDWTNSAPASRRSNSPGVSCNTSWSADFSMSYITSRRAVDWRDS